MPKYQIGDTVRTKIRTSGIERGTLGKITKNDRGISIYPYSVLFERQMLDMPMLASEIERVEEEKVSGNKFKVGDKVTRQSGKLGSTFIKGKVYTVRKVEETYHDIALEGLSSWYYSDYFDKYVPTTLKDAKVGDTVRVVIEGKVTKVNTTTVRINTPPFGERDYDAKREAEIIEKAKPFAEKPGTVFKHTHSGDMYIRRDDGKVTSLTSGNTYENVDFLGFVRYEIVYTPE